MADIEKARRNVRRMIDGGAGSDEIDLYLEGEGLSAEALRQAAKPARPWDAADAGAVPGAAMRQGPDIPGAAGRSFGEFAGQVGRFADDSVRSLARGIPFLGAKADQADPQPELDAAFAERHPMLAGALPFVGGVASMLPLAATRLGSAALGLRGSVPMRVAAGGASGAAIGAGDTAIRGGSAEDIQRTAGITGGIGAAIPIFGPAIGQAAGALARAVKPSGAAARQMRSALRADRVTPEELAMRSVNALPMDAGRNTAAMVRKVASERGPAQEGVRNAVEGRFAQAEQMETQLNQAARREFGAALGNAKPVNVSPVIQAFDSVSIPRGGTAWRWVVHFRKELLGADKLPVYDPAILHRVQTEMWQRAKQLRGGGDEGNVAANVIDRLRESLVKQIDDAAGGSYRPTQRWYAQEMERIEDMLPEGAVAKALSQGLDTSALNEANRGLSVRKVGELGLEGAFLGGASYLGGDAPLTAAAILAGRRGLSMAGRKRDRAVNRETAKLLSMSPTRLSALLSGAPKLGQSRVPYLLAPVNAGATPRLVGP